MRENARVVIIGGGVHGASLLYHLALEGWTDTILVEKAELTSGSTWHAAGQITRSVGDYTTAAFHHYALELYGHLAEDTGQEVSLHTPGGIRVAYTEEEMEALRTHLGIGRYLGYPIELLGPDELQKLNPFYNFDDVIAGIWTEGEGHVDPSGVTMAFANGARAKGAEISRNNRVVEVNNLANGEWEVVTELGTITCEHVVDAGGCYADQVAALSGFRVPQANVLHHYLVTEEIPELAANLDWEMPVMRDNRAAGYIRQEQTAGLIGIYELEGAEQIWKDGVPWDAVNPLFPADYDKIAPWLEEAFNRAPIMGEVGIKRVVHGAITHTTDGHMLLGPAPGVKNYWLNTGSSIGLAWGPGAGRELARWMVHGETELSLRHFDPRRFGWADHDYIDTKCVEDYEWMFRVHPPGHERMAERPVRTSGVHGRLAEKRAIFTQSYGWESPKWFVPEDMPMEDAVGWRRPAWFEPVREECKAVRERVGVMDLTAFAKYEVVGADAHTFLDRVCSGRIPTKDGKINLNYMLTPTGRIESEITVTRFAENRYYVITAAFNESKDIDWLNQHIEAGEDVRLLDKSTSRGVLVLVGPDARATLAACTDEDVSNEAFPFLNARDFHIKVGGNGAKGSDQADDVGMSGGSPDNNTVEVLCLRVGFTGARGWELHMDVDKMGAVYDALVEAGAQFDIRDFGNHALNSLRIEKMYLTRFELTHDIGPMQANVEFFVKQDKGDFIGKDALNKPTTGNAWKLVYLDVDTDSAEGGAGSGAEGGAGSGAEGGAGSGAEGGAGSGAEGGAGSGADCLGGEGVFASTADDAAAIGLTTSGGYGFTVEKSLAFAYVDEANAAPGTELGVLILNEMRKAIVLDGPAFDPNNKELRG